MYNLNYLDCFGLEKTSSNFYGVHGVGGSNPLAPTINNDTGEAERSLPFFYVFAVSVNS